MSSLPQPSPDQRNLSQKLTQMIVADIEKCGGWISFSRFMELALYAPGLGYYSAGSKKFGAGGDFVTAPEISPLFGRALARQVAQVLREMGGDVLELGAGTGRLAVDLLQELQRQEALPQHYRILEVSAHLRAVQRETLAAALPEALLSRVEWLEALPDAIEGVVVANEVFDALPVHLVAWRPEGLCERGVCWQDDRFVWQERPLESSVLLERLVRLALPVGYVSEYCLAASALVASLADRLSRGAMLFVDYGFPRREYYHPQRRTGTLMCHYRQHAHDDPFMCPGLQDITAHVDFTMVAESALEHGLDVLGYTTQAQFLMNCGLMEMLAEVSPEDAARYVSMVAQVQKLLSPAEMGELFKVIGFGKGVSGLQGFSQGDKRHTL
jgi:SAM-dependent MidA family methyltransferase